MAKTIPGVPESLTREQFLSIFEAINVDPKDCTDLRLAPDGIYVTAIARHPGGQPVIHGNEIAKHSVFIPVREDDEEEGK